MQNIRILIIVISLLAFASDVSFSQDIPTVMYASVEVKPTFLGGPANSFGKWLGKNIRYPETARENGIQGRVTVQFIINQDGSVSDVKVLSGTDKLLDAEAIRVISKSPKWEPGKQDGKPVKVKFVYPVVFRIQD